MEDILSRQNKKARTEERIKARDRIKIFLFKSAIEGNNGMHITRNVKKHSLKSEGRAIFIQDLLVELV